MKRNFHSDGQQFHQYQLSENSPNPKPQINEIYIKKKKKKKKKRPRHIILGIQFLGWNKHKHVMTGVTSEAATD
jgi:hypothetical protein